MSRQRFGLILLLCGAACGGGGEKAGAGSSTAAVSPSTPGSTAAPTPGATAGTPAAITGKTWDVKMIGDATGYRYDPPSLTIQRVDGVRWYVVSGPPHNVTFWPDSIPSGAQAQLAANMPQSPSLLASPLFANLGQTYTVSFGGVPAGTYHYYCTPHLALGMKGAIVVQ
jgi:plastocyanin